MPRGNNAARIAMEQHVASALERGNYKYYKDRIVGRKLGTQRPYKTACAVDALGRVHAILMRWQRVGGTTEDKIPFDVIRLIDLLQSNKDCSTAHLILGGDGWSNREFLVGGGLQAFIPNSEQVNITSLDDFIDTANQGLL